MACVAFDQCHEHIMISCVSAKAIYIYNYFRRALKSEAPSSLCSACAEPFHDQVRIPGPLQGNVQVARQIREHLERR